MTPCFHVRHVLLMPATCDCAWLLTMPIVATMRGHRSLALLDRSHYDPFEPCAPGEFRVFESVVVLQLLLFCRHCCNSDGRFATLFEICGYDCCDSSIEICLARQSIYLVLRRGCWGWARNPGCSSILAVQDGRYVAGYVRRWEGVVGGYQPWMWRGPCCGYHNQTGFIPGKLCLV